MRIGYIRALPDDQSFALQRDILRRSRCSQIYEEIREQQRNDAGSGDLSQKIYKGKIR